MINMVENDRNGSASRLAAEISADGSLQPCGALADDVAQVLQVITGRDAEAAHKVLGSGFEVSIVFAHILILRTTKVGVGRDGCGALEALKSCLGLGLCVGVVVTATKVLVRRDALLGAEFGASKVVGFLCAHVSFMILEVIPGSAVSHLQRP